MMRRHILCLSALILLGICGCYVGDKTQARTDEISELKLPPGFHISLFASGMDAPRLMAMSPDGRLFVTEMGAGQVTILPDANGDNRADRHTVYASGLDRPHGIAFHRRYLYVAQSSSVVRYLYRSGDVTAPKPETVVSNLPSGGGHVTRTIIFDQNGKMYVSIGSSCNVCIENNPLRAAIVQYNADGSGRRIFATGLRNSVGMAWNPVSKALWATDNGRDRLGDNIPPDEVNVIRQGGFYGWPYAYGNRVPDPQFGRSAPDKVKSSIPPKIAIQAHSAPLGLTFYTGKQLPAEYQGNLLVAYHGSWNRSVPTGYKVVRFVVRSDGTVVGGQRDLITGWLKDGKSWGRPVDLLAGRSGELYITDDAGGKVYIVTYRK